MFVLFAPDKFNLFTVREFVCELQRVNRRLTPKNIKNAFDSQLPVCLFRSVALKTLQFKCKKSISHHFSLLLSSYFSHLFF